MKSLLTKYWSFLALIFAFVLDNQTRIIEQVVKDPFWVKTIYLFGTLVYGYFFTSSHNAKKVKKTL